MKFRVVDQGIYEDTGDRMRDRLVMYATPSGALMVGPGLGHEEEMLYEAVPEELHEQALKYWRKEDL